MLWILNKIYLKIHSLLFRRGQISPLKSGIVLFETNCEKTCHLRLKCVLLEVNYFSCVRKPFWTRLGHWINVWNRHQACYHTKTCRWSCVTWRKRKVNNVFVARITIIEEANLFSPCVCLEDCNLFDVCSTGTEWSSTKCWKINWHFSRGLFIGKLVAVGSFGTFTTPQCTWSDRS